MKVVMFIGVLWFLLLGGGQGNYAHSKTGASSASAHFNHTANQTFNFNKKEDGKVLIEVTDIDVEEEHLTSEEFHDLDNASAVTAKPTMFENIFRFHSHHFRFYHHNNYHFFAKSSQDYSTRIYIKYLDLRI